MSEGRLNEARELHRQGDYQSVVKLLQNRLEEATLEEELIYCLAMAMDGEVDTVYNRMKELASIEPENSLWQSDSALAFLLLGDIERSAKMLEQILLSNQACAVDYGRMAALHLAKMELQEAAECYNEAVMREPGRAEWHSNFAGILVRQQRLEEALEHYDRALSLKPDMPQAQQARQQVMVALDKTGQIVGELEFKLKQNQDDISLRWQLIRALSLDGQVPQAFRLIKEVLLPLSEFEALCEQDKEDVSEQDREKIDNQMQALSVMAEIARAHERHRIALNSINWQLLWLDEEKRIPPLVDKANILIELGDCQSAQKSLDEARDLLPEHWPGHALEMAQATLLSEAGKHSEAESRLREMLEVYPGDPKLLSQLGQTLLWVGKVEEAGDCFNKAAEINPSCLANMVNAKRIPEDSASIEKMCSMADNPLMPQGVRISMSFALHEVLENRHEFDKAFGYLKQANELVEKTLSYNPEQFTKKISAIIDVFKENFLQNLRPIRHGDVTPVFVVGMPRSGTTLTEQILCSHPEVFGAGELPLVAQITNLMPKVLKTKKKYPYCVGLLNPHLREEAARFYLKGIREFDEEHSFVVDKMPHNFQHLGLIATILPGARIIHIMRDPRDVALSNFQQNFKAKHGGMGYSFNLEKIAAQINDYHRIMEHWRRVLPVPMFELTYEELVSDQEGMTGRLLDFIGLDWDDSVREFYKTSRAVKTASVAQVRQPVYQTSRQKWRRYEKDLKLLLEKLNPETYAGWDR